MGEVLTGLLVIFGSIALHELGHYAAYRRFGVMCSEVSAGIGPRFLWRTDSNGTLWSLRMLPIAGYTTPPEGVGHVLKADMKFKVSIAGPLVNAALMVVAFLLDSRFLFELNAALLMLNLVPLPPLDGGRAVFALAEMRWGFSRVDRVNQWASPVGFLLMIALQLGSCGYQIASRDRVSKPDRAETLGSVDESPDAAGNRP